MPKMYETIIMIILTGVILGLSGLLYCNRGSSKILEVYITVIVVMVGALLYVTKEEIIEKKINAVYFINVKEKSPMFFIDNPILRDYFFQQGLIYGTYKQRASDRHEECHPFTLDDRSLVYLHSITVLNHLLHFYGLHWYSKKESFEGPSSRVVSWGPKQDKAIEGDVVKYDLNKLATPSLQKNIFFDSLSVFETTHTGLALPQGTQFFYMVDAEIPSSCEFRFYKRFNFDIRIKIYRASAMMSLGKVGDYIGLTDIIEQGVMDSRDENVRNYQNATVVMRCDAKFFRLLAYNPKVILYKEWVNSLFDDLYNTYEWSIYEEKMRRHQQDLSIHKIINKLK